MATVLAGSAAFSIHGHSSYTKLVPELTLLTELGQLGQLGQLRHQTHDNAQTQVTRPTSVRSRYECSDARSIGNFPLSGTRRIRAHGRAGRTGCREKGFVGSGQERAARKPAP